MTVAIVQQNGGQSSTPNPSLSFGKRVTAGNFLYALISQNSTLLPGNPACSLGQQFLPLDGISHPTGLSIAQYRFPNTMAGACTLTFPTVAASSFAIVEFSGVHADVNVGTEFEIDQPNSNSMAWSSGIDHYTTCNPLTAADFVLAFLFAQGQTPLTFTPTGWTPVADIGNADLTFSVRSLQVATLGPVTAHWTTPNLSVSCVGSISLQPA